MVNLERFLSSQHVDSPLCLVVIDSITALFRGESEPSYDATQRSSDLFCISAHLKRLADEHDLVILCVNQVSDIVSSTSSDGDSSVPPVVAHRCFTSP